MRIALVSESFLPTIGGAELTIHNLASRLVEKGHEAAALVGFGSWRRLRHEQAAFPYRLEPLPPRFGKMLARWPSLYLPIATRYFQRAQARHRFDLWHSFSAFPAGVAVARFASKRNLPHVVRSMGGDLQLAPELGYGLRRDPRVDRLIRTWLPSAGRVVALTPSHLPVLREVGVPVDRGEIIPCGVDVDRFRAASVDRDGIRGAYGLPQDAFLFVAVGRNHPKKGFPVLLEAFLALREKTEREVHLAFVGAGMAPLRELVRRAGAESWVSFIEGLGPDLAANRFQAPPESLIRIYKAADACVMPSLLESFGNVNIEAMAAGLPLVTTDAPGCRDVAEDGRSALVVRAGDPRDLEAKMLQVLEDPALRRRLSMGALARVEERFSWSLVLSEYESLYSRLCNQMDASVAGRASERVAERANPRIG